MYEAPGVQFPCWTPENFVQNHIHDAESMWWVIFKRFAFTHPVDAPEVTDDWKDRRSTQAKRWFPVNIFDREHRNNNPFSNPRLLGDRMSVMPKAYRRIIKNVLVPWALGITVVYAAYETKPVKDETVMADLHCAMRVFFEQGKGRVESLQGILKRL